MAYRSDLYNIRNIIGYTGQLHRLPTIYFRDDAQNIYGRITQQHRYSFNVGRGEPASTVGYDMRNEMVNGRRVLREYKNNVVQHTSRNPFIPVDTSAFDNPRSGGDLTAIAILSQSIQRFTQPKATADLSRAEMYDVHIAIAQKGNMLNELTQVAATVTDMTPSRVAQYVEIDREVDANVSMMGIHDAPMLRAHYAAMAKRGRN